MDTVSNELIERFFRYVAISSQSDATNNQVPSSPGQLALAKQLADELNGLQMNDVCIDEHGILTAHFVGHHKTAPKIGFVAHLDTVDVGLSPDIHPQILTYSGHDLCLNTDNDCWLKTTEHPEMIPYKDQEIIFSDGTSVLGADNKAAIAVIMTLLSDIKKKASDYGDIYVAFVPDEEIGLRGSKLLNLNHFPVDFAYTIDCCELGELVYETFNAASFIIKIKGVTAHPMSAKDVLVNPIRVAYDLISGFDYKDSPEHTSGIEGYFYIKQICANPDNAILAIDIRDFDKQNYEARKQYLIDAIERIKDKHAKAKIEFTVEDVYSNIKDTLTEDTTALDLLFSAFNSLSIDANVIAMRGGTDGSALSKRGIFTPNYFTGAHNFHSCFEFLPISSFVKSYQVTKKICELATKKGDQ